MTKQQAFEIGFQRKLDELMTKQAGISDFIGGMGRMGGRTGGTVTRGVRNLGGMWEGAGQAWREGRAVGRLAGEHGIPMDRAQRMFTRQQGLSNAQHAYISRYINPRLNQLPEEMRGQFTPLSGANPVTRASQFSHPADFNNFADYKRQFNKAHAAATAAPPGAAPAAGGSAGGGFGWDNVREAWNGVPTPAKVGLGAGLGAGALGNSLSVYGNNAHYDYQQEHPLMSWFGRQFAGMPQYQHKSYLMPSFMQ